MNYVQYFMFSDVYSVQYYLLSAVYSVQYYLFSDVYSVHTCTCTLQGREG